ncbi:MAG TPA: hypothetical protein VJL80_06450 [Aeromicrobium sp.]|nr:hypothetical protein [Aeromicrobium sp.]HKY57659.1 hypothetical protein [Aeromicrobium sp.]
MIGDDVEWGEAIGLVQTLAADPSSYIAASVSGWDYPITYEAAAVMNLFDLMHDIAWQQGGRKGSRPRPHPRPWRDRAKSRPKPTISQDEVVAALMAAGHPPPKGYELN